MTPQGASQPERRPACRQAVLDEQIAYYRARAAEYDEWFFRRGRYDHGPEHNARWQAQVRRVREALDGFALTGEVLELACGTGLWTEQLLRHADHVTAVDAAPEMLALVRERVASERLRTVQADVFTWRPGRRFDGVFFGFWLSHVPGERFEAFWQLVSAALRPGGKVFFVDSLRTPESTARDHRLPDAEAGIAARRLNDGREFRVVKIFHDPAALAERLATLGWAISVQRTADFFLYGSGGRA